MLTRLEDLLYTHEGSEQSMYDLISRYGFEVYSSSEDEHSLLYAVEYQLNRLWKVTNCDELRQEAVKYLEKCPALADNTPLQKFVQDEEWSKYLDEMRDSHHCDHLMLMALATVLRRTIVLYSGAEPNLEPINIIPDNRSERLRPIHVGHLSGLTFVTLRCKSDVQAQQFDDDDDWILPDESDSIIQEDEMEEDATDAESPNEVQFQHTPAGETTPWNVRYVFCFLCRLQRESKNDATLVLGITLANIG